MFGCATATKIGGVQIGMTKQQVIEIMGKPVSVSAKDETEYLNYALYETSDDAFYGLTYPYYVRLVGGKVDSYGRSGDFDSTQTPTVRIETDQNIQQNVQGNSDLYSELVRLEELRKSGILTQDEFDKQKQIILNRN